MGTQMAVLESGGCLALIREGPTSAGGVPSRSEVAGGI